MKAFIRNHRVMVLIVLAGILAIWFVYGSQAFQDCVCNQENSYAQQPPKERTPLLSFALSNYGACLWHWLDKNNGAIIALFTIIIGTFTGFLFVDGRDKGRKELRAYLSVNSVEIRQDSRGLIKKNGGPIITVQIKNHGQTPAKAFDVAAALYIAPYPLPDSHEFLPSPTFQGVKATIHPRQTFICGAFSPREIISAESAVAMSGGGQRFYVFAKIKYLNIFGGRCETEHCASFTDIRADEKGRWGMYVQMAPVHNEAT